MKQAGPPTPLPTRRLPPTHRPPPVGRLHALLSHGPASFLPVTLLIPPPTSSTARRGRRHFPYPATKTLLLPSLARSGAVGFFSAQAAARLLMCACLTRSGCKRLRGEVRRRALARIRGVCLACAHRDSRLGGRRQPCLACRHAVPGQAPATLLPCRTLRPVPPHLQACGGVGGACDDPRTAGEHVGSTGPSREHTLKVWPGHYAACF